MPRGLLFRHGLLLPLRVGPPTHRDHGWPAGVRPIEQQGCRTLRRRPLAGRAAGAKPEDVHSVSHEGGRDIVLSRSTQDSWYRSVAGRPE
jgi:hypothetical protein